MQSDTKTGGHLTSLPPSVQFPLSFAPETGSDGSRTEWEFSHTEPMDRLGDRHGGQTKHKRGTQVRRQSEASGDQADR